MDTSLGKISLKSHVKDLDKIISRYIRKKYADKRGLVRCFTCGKEDYWKNMDCSHFISRTKWAVRFNEDNLRPCCQYCNRYLHGNLKVFREHLIKDIGLKRVTNLEQRRFDAKKYTNEELTSMIEHYQNKILDLK